MLESRPGGRKGQVEASENTDKVSIELADGFRQEVRRRVLLISPPPPIESDNGISILKERDIADGAVD